MDLDAQTYLPEVRYSECSTQQKILQTALVFERAYMDLDTTPNSEEVQSTYKEVMSLRNYLKLKDALISEFESLQTGA